MLNLSEFIKEIIKAFMPFIKCGTVIIIIAIIKWFVHANREARKIWINNVKSDIINWIKKKISK